MNRQIIIDERESVS